MPPTTRERGRYEAVQATDGTWSILDVPIFAEHEFTWTDKAGKTKSAKVDRAWLERCRSIHSRRLEETGNLPPSHLGHHSSDHPEEELPNLGFVRPKDVRVGVLDGVQRAVLYGDFASIPDEYYQQIRDGRIPYVSVEAMLGKGFLKSCAFLSSHSSAFPFPPISVGRETPSGGKVLPAPDEVLAFSVTGIGARAITRLSPMAESKKPDEAPVAPVQPAPPVAPSAPATPPEAPKEPEKPDEKAPSWAQSLVAMMQQLVAAVTGGKALQPKDTGSPVDVPGAAMAYSAEIAELKGTVSALKGERDAEKADRAMHDAATAGAKELVGKYAVADTIENDLFETAKKHGIAAMRVQVDTIKRDGRKAPATRLEDVGGTDSEVLPAEVMKYSADTAQMADALRLSRQYDAVRAAGYCQGKTREQYIATGLKCPRLTPFTPKVVA